MDISNTLFHDALEKLMLEYSSIYQKVKTNEDWKNPFRETVSKEIPDIIRSKSSLDDKYKIVGSYGKGRWTEVPWIAVFDTRITDSAQRGAYIVYLLNKDTKELYLSFNVAATESMDVKTKSDGKVSFVGVVGNNNQQLLRKIREKAAQIRVDLPDEYFNADNNIKTGASGYDAGSIYYKKYTVDDLPNDEILLLDLKRMVSIYQHYYELSMNQNVDWIPSLEEYDPGISKDQWITLLNDEAIFGPVWLHTLAFFYANKEGATCTDIAAQYGSTAQSINATCTQIAKHVYDAIKCPLNIPEGSDKGDYWSILFQGRYVDSKEPGMFAWRLREELYEALEEFDILRFLVEKPMAINTKDALNKITEYIAARGFTYSDNLIENFYLSLKSKPFVILAGTSGTGKTRLVKLFAEAMGAGYKLVPVRPDWSDGSDLFGHHDLNGNFIKGSVCECFEMAESNPDKPVFLCLDEMNLARVEYYLSDFLSVIESREKQANGSIYTTPIAQYEEGIPNNLYIVGTVNMDETTFPFSKKVLDRANTIEFSYVELTPAFEAADSVPEPLVLANDFLKTEYLVLGRDCADEQEFVTDICSTLQEINEILKKANAHVGYRVRDEIVFYMLNNKKAGNLLSDDEAMDNEIMQKILPRIQGSSSAIKNLLVELFNFCYGTGTGIEENAIDVGGYMRSAAEKAKYPESAKKISYMMTRFEDDGFTSYWL